MPSEARERLSDGIYRTVEPGNPIGLLQEALVLSMTAEPLEKRIRVEGVKAGRSSALDQPGQNEQALAIGRVTAAEAEFRREYDRKVMDLVIVEDFASEELMAGIQAEDEARPLLQIA
jgi:acyl-CoA dehydrogenase